jgi:hypothetical protein
MICAVDETISSKAYSQLMQSEINMIVKGFTIKKRDWTVQCGQLLIEFAWEVGMNHFSAIVWFLYNAVRCSINPQSVYINQLLYVLLVFHGGSDSTVVYRS